MKYDDWAKATKNNLSNLTDPELHLLANSDEPDASKLANEILLERANKLSKAKIGTIDEDWR